MSLQKASGLRQTFFRDGQLKISRLGATVPRLSSVPFADHLFGEVEKLRRYLNSLALISRDSPLSIYILSHGQLLTEFEQHCHDSDNEKFVLLDVDQVATRVGLDEGSGTHYSDVMFAHLLASEVPLNHYARPEETQYYTLHRLRLALATASLADGAGQRRLERHQFHRGRQFQAAGARTGHAEIASTGSATNSHAPSCRRPRSSPSNQDRGGRGGELASIQTRPRRDICCRTPGWRARARARW